MNISTDWIKARSSKELLERFRFHDRDRGCVNMQQELRRMFLMQEIGAELERRGVQYL